MKVINIVTQKGGTGKTETAKNLAFGLAEKGKKILLVDLDPQANSTSAILNKKKRTDIKSLDLMCNQYDELIKTSEKSTGLEGFEILSSHFKKNVDEYDVSDVLLQPALIKKSIQETKYKNLDIVPSSISLIETDMKLKQSAMKVDTRLDAALQLVSDKYDICVIDNSPVINGITVNGITACINEGDIIIIPIKIDEGGIAGFVQTYEQMKEILEYSPTLGFDFKLLFTMRNRTNVEKETEKRLRHLSGNRCFETTIRYQAKPVTNASLENKVLIADSTSNVAKDYRNLVEEIYELI